MKIPVFFSARSRSLPKPVQRISKRQKRKIRQKTLNAGKSGSGNFQTGSGNFQTGSGNFQTGSKNFQTGWNDPHETALFPTMHPGPEFGPNRSIFVHLPLVTDRVPENRFLEVLWINGL